MTNMTDTQEGPLRVQGVQIPAGWRNMNLPLHVSRVGAKSSSITATHGLGSCSGSNLSKVGSGSPPLTSTDPVKDEHLEAGWINPSFSMTASSAAVMFIHGQIYT